MKDYNIIFFYLILLFSSNFYILRTTKDSLNRLSSSFIGFNPSLHALYREEMLPCRRINAIKGCSSPPPQASRILRALWISVNSIIKTQKVKYFVIGITIIPKFVNVMNIRPNLLADFTYIHCLPLNLYIYFQFIDFLSALD